MKHKHKLAAVLLALGIGFFGCVPLPEGEAAEGGPAQVETETAVPPGEEDRVVISVGGTPPSEPPATPEEPSSQATPPKEETEPAPTGLVVNDDVVLLVGATNGEIKALNGEAADVSVIYGGLPYVSYRFDSKAPYPYGFFVWGVTTSIEEGLALEQEERENFDKTRNYFRDTYIVMGIEIGDSPEDIFVGGATLTYDMVCDAFLQYPELTFIEAGYNDAEYTTVQDMYFAVYSYSTGGRDFFIKFAFEHRANEYVVERASVVLQEYESLLEIMF